jgi:carboxyl-terminal processing protease|nr:S41 family peptidase [Bacteroidales bacterium]
MQPAINIADELIEKDRLIVYTEGRNSPKQPFSSQVGGSFEKGKLVVLVDEASASASEILSGAIQDWDRGIIVGRRSYGKGLVQRPLGLNDGSEIRLTIARYHTPSGRCIQKPYVEGHKKEYSKDLMKRFESGELVNADSIDFPDSLIYKTLIEGRTVYGGGGIIPDVFVPLDTISYSKFHRQVIASGVLNEFMMSYMDNERKELEKKYTSFEKFNSKFEISEGLFQEMVAKAAEDSIVYDAEEFAISHDFLFLQMKAIVARDLFEMSEYFQVINSRNNSVLKAVELLDHKKKRLAEYSIK